MITAISNNKVQHNTNLKQRTPIFKAKAIKASVDPEKVQSKKESLLSFLLKPFKKFLTPKETPLEWESTPYKHESTKKSIDKSAGTPLEW